WPDGDVHGRGRGHPRRPWHCGEDAQENHGLMVGALQFDARGETPVARLVGEIDASNAPGFASELKERLPNSAIGLVLDLSETTYIDSAGLHLIFDLSDALRRRQQA